MKYNHSITTKRALIRLLSTVVLLLSFQQVIAQSTVTIDHSVRRYVGDVSTLDRSKFFNLHSNSNDAELNAFYNDYNVGKGRGFWGPYSYSKGKGNPIGTYPSNKTGDGSVRNVSRFIATEHPYNIFKDGLDPVAAGNWAAEYYKNYVNDSERPEFFEPMNEPFVHASDYYDGWDLAEEARIKRQMAEVFSAVGEKIHAAPELAKMKVIGYSAAWPSMEIDDFGHWRDNMKMFMDVAGANMDGFATHLYDGVNVTGQNNQRSGSNSEAILDLIETYSHTKWGTVKPHSISEYGSIAKGYPEGYSDVESVQTVRAINNMLFNLLDRENKIDISIPFITDKSIWHLTEENNYQPYTPTLLIPTNLGEPVPAGWRYTPKIHFFELWKEVKGNRVHVSTNNPDIQIQGFADGNKLYVALNNLDDASQVVNLNFAAGLSGLQNVKIKRLKIYDQQDPVMSINTQSASPNSMTLIAGETAVLEYTFASNIVFNNRIRDQKYYTSKHLQSIKANSAISFTFNGVGTGNGEAALHMGIGRKHDRSKAPEVKVNGTKVPVPSNWKGYDQADRDDFFGVIEIPFDINLLQSSNTITVTFPDGGGHISSMILEVKKYDIAPTNETIVISNPPSTIQSSKNIPVSVNYTASQTRDVVVEFWSSTSWLGETREAVNAGSGQANVTVNLNTAPAVASGYIIKTSIRPTGGDWTTNIDSDQVNDITVTSASSQSPYGGTAALIPGKVEAENYDLGGNDIAYKDSDTANAGGQYRTDGVDIETCSDADGGYNIGWMNAGEWLEYTVNVSTSQDYDFYPRVASVNSSAQIKILVDGVDMTGALNVPNTGGWQAYHTMHLRNIYMTAGTHIIRFEVVGTGLNFNYWAAWASPAARQSSAKSSISTETQVYPNPVKDNKLYIDLPLNEKSKIQIFDINGALVYEQDLEQNQSVIPTAGLKAGVYIVKVYMADKQHVEKIIIQ